MIEIHALSGMDELGPSCDLPGELAAALKRLDLRPMTGDVLVVTRKVALGDRIAGAAGMIMGEAAEGIPAALARSADQDLFR